MNDGGSAFPSADERFADPWPGMSLRDYFAAASLAGQRAHVGMGLSPEAAVRFAYADADAALARREMRPEDGT